MLTTASALKRASRFIIVPGLELEDADQRQKRDDQQDLADPVVIEQFAAEEGEDIDQDGDHG